MAGMQDGIYKVSFQVGSNWGHGIVTLSDGRVSGGDEGFTYVGSLSGEQQFTATIQVKQHNPAVSNVFAGLTNFQLCGQGQWVSPVHARLLGTTPAALGQTVQVELAMLAAF